MTMILLFSLPMIVGNIFQQLYNIADVIIVGKFVGSGALSAVGSTGSLVFLLVQFSTAGAMGFAVVTSQFFGAKQYDKTKTAITTTLISMVIFGGALAGFCLIFIDPVLGLLNTPSEIFGEAKKYVVIYLLGGVFLFLYNAVNASFNALGDSVTSFIFLAVSSVLNVALDLVFVLCLGMGVEGVAIATLLSEALSAALSFIVLLLRLRKFKRRTKAFDFAIFCSMCKIAVPTILQQIIVTLGNFMLQSLTNSYGETVIAATTAVTKVDGVLVSIIINYGNAIASFTGQNIGAGRMDRVREGHISGQIISFATCPIMILIAYFFGERLMSVFLIPGTANYGEIVGIGVEMLRSLTPFYVLFSIMVCFNGAHRGAGNLGTVVACSMVNLGIRVALAYALSPIIGYSCLWWSSPVGWFFGCLISSYMFISGRWKKRIINVGGSRTKDQESGA